MAINKFSIAKHGVVEINRVTAFNDRNIEAQTPVKASIKELENGMIVFVDRINNVVTFEKKSCPYLHFSTVRNYTTGERGTNSFVFEVNNEEELPRLAKLVEGDMFHTNLVKYDTSEFANDAALLTALANDKRVYAYVDGTDGFLQVTKTAKADETCEFVIALSTMQDDTIGFQTLVNKANSVANSGNASI